MDPRIVVRACVGTSAGILQQQDQVFKRLFISKPVLIVVQRGIKELRCSGGEYTIRSGEAIAVAGGQTVDITTRLGEHDRYQARWLVWDSALVAAHGAAHPQQAVITQALSITQHSAEFKLGFERALQAVEDATIPETIARHRVAELLLWIGSNGGRFAPSQVLTLAMKIRHLVGQNLAGNWSANAVASAFAISEATLRRKLADEGTNLSDILVDARMTFALTLLQSTAQSVTQIALHVGYQTPSHFATRFRNRFGVPPTSIRGHQRGVAGPNA
ncbi:MAG: AraC family transcriptional regulator [Pseudomonadota bacterium]